MRRYRCILTQTLVCLQILLYTHYPSLSLCRYCFAPFYQLNSWKRLFYSHRKFMQGIAFFTQKIFCLLLLCGISELQDNKYTMITERIRNIFVYDKNLHARKIFHKTVEMYLKYTNRYTHIHIYIYMQFSEITFLVPQNIESNTLPSELLIRIRKIINEKM